MGRQKQKAPSLPAGLRGACCCKFLAYARPRRQSQAGMRMMANRNRKGGDGLHR